MKIKFGKKKKQFSSLYLTMIISVFIGIGVSMVNTRLLEPSDYGKFKYIINLVTLAQLFITFGVFISGGRLVALKENENKKSELLGILLVIAVFISLLFSVGFFGFSFINDNIFHNDLGLVIRLFSPFYFVFIFKKMLERYLPGVNKIYSLSILRIGPKTLYLISMLILNLFFDINLYIVLLTNMLTLALVTVFIIIRMKPEFKNLKLNLSKVLQETKTYGIHVYVGILIGVATKHLASIIIAYYLDTAQVGFFALARSITMPLELVPATIGTVYFKDFAQKNKIPQRIIKFSLLSSIAFLIIFLISIKYVFFFLYTKNYIPALPLIYLLSFGQILRGFGYFINRFLGAHGQGKYLRNTAFIVGFINLAGFFILIKILGTKGAAITSIIAYLVYLMMNVYYYRKYIHSSLGNNIK